MSLPPQSVVVAEIRPEVSRNGSTLLRVEYEVVSVFVRQRRGVGILQSDEGFIKGIRGYSRPARAGAYRTASRAVVINIVSQRFCDEQIDRSASEELVGYFRESLLSHICAIRVVKIKTDAANCELLSRPFLIRAKQSDLARGESFVE